MDWDKITIHNFLSIEHAEIALNNRGIILIEGQNKTSPKFKSNGSGKTSIAEAIVYALFDTTTKGLKADEVINNKVAKQTNCSVILEGHRGEDTYRIERYRKHTKHKSKVLLFINGEEATEAKVDLTNKKIQKIIGMDFNTFTNSILFSQGNGAGRFAVATDKEKKEILENLVNLEIYAKAQDLAKNRVKAEDNKILEKQREGERLQWELAQVDTLEAQDRQNNVQTQNLIAQTKVDIESAEAQIKAYSEGTAEDYEKWQQFITHLEAKLETQKGVDISAETENVQSIRDGLQRVANDVEKLDYNKAQLVKKYQQLATNTTCPVCGSEMDNSHKEQEQEAVKIEIKDILVKRKELEEQISLVQPIFENAKADLEAKQKTQQELHGQYQQIVQALEKYRRAVRDHDFHIQSLQNKIQSSQTTLEGLQTVSEPPNRDEERKAIKERIKAQKTQLLALERQKTALEDVVKTFSNTGVKSYVLDLVTPFLNEQGNKYLSVLAGPDMELIFNTQTPNKDGTMTDKFDVKLLNANGGDEYKGNSGGEQKRADLAITLALQDYVLSKSESKFNFVFYDEIFDALDEIGAENVIELLKKRLDKVGTIFVITHSDHLKNLFENVMTVTKGKDGISVITEGVAS